MTQIENLKILTHWRSTVIDNITYVGYILTLLKCSLLVVNGYKKKKLHMNLWDWWIFIAISFTVFEFSYLWKHVSLYIYDNRILFLVIEIVNSAKRFGSIIGNFKLYSSCTIKLLPCHCVFQEFQFHFIIWIMSIQKNIFLSRFAYYKC